MDTFYYIINFSFCQEIFVGHTSTICKWLYSRSTSDKNIIY
nr:MAG TPA: hypothetical protein [Caudoviricetes sp.]